MNIKPGPKIPGQVTYGLVWVDRWNGVFETFMLGGRLPATEPLYPNGFAAALKAEAEAIK